MKRTAAILAAMMILIPCAVAFAGDEGGVVQKVGHGEVNWTGKVITVTGSAAPNLKGGAVPAQIRLQTERAAELDAYRKVLEIVKGVNIDSKQTIGAQMQSSPEVKAKVEGVIKNMKRIDTKYYSDGGVDVVVQVALDGALTESVVKSEPKKTETAAKDAAPSGFTGLVVDARGLKLVPALSPKIVDETGKPLYEAGTVEPEIMKASGAIAYFLSVDSAKKNAKVTDNPLIVKAIKVSDNGKSDLVVAKDDAAKLDGKDFLKKGRVVVVVD
ncbi:MAG: hypothetical protein WC889_10555 [Myxococcota bacterium]|jgi:hypothetical protein